jgi:predicted aldo/keto reductase-like oxidoreductase
LGNTGHSSTIVAFGSIAATVPRDPKDGQALLLKAIDDWGINHVDVAPSYAKGEAERRIGEVMKSRRKQVFLACKTLKRTAKEAEEELHTSLRTLNTDHFDLYQFHALDAEEDLKIVLGPGGAMEAFEPAQRAGKVRFIGVTGHRADIQLQLIRQAAINTVMVPVDFIDRFAAGLNAEEGLIPACKEKGIGVIAIKATMRGKVKDKATAYRYTLSQDVATTVPAGNPEDHEVTVHTARNFVPLTKQAEAELLATHEELKGICRQCNYCLPCPLGIEIPRVLAIWLRMGRFPSSYTTQWLKNLSVPPSKCNRCGDCERRCPYEIRVASILLEQVAPKI